MADTARIAVSASFAFAVLAAARMSLGQESNPS
jgi:hypothetical protein